MSLGPEVNPLNVGIARYLIRRAFAKDRSGDQDRDPFGKPKYELHVVLDEQDGNVIGERFDGLHDLIALRGRHARRRLVKQQHGGLSRKRKRDLQQALPPVGKLASWL